MRMIKLIYCLIGLCFLSACTLPVPLNSDDAVIDLYKADVLPSNDDTTVGLDNIPLKANRAGLF